MARGLAAAVEGGAISQAICSNTAEVVSVAVEVVINR
jgi:hypothetical protein